MRGFSPDNWWRFSLSAYRNGLIVWGTPYHGEGYDCHGGLPMCVTNIKNNKNIVNELVNAITQKPIEVDVSPANDLYADYFILEKKIGGAKTEKSRIKNSIGFSLKIENEKISLFVRLPNEDKDVARHICKTFSILDVESGVVVKCILEIIESNLSL